jgi:hypothetical protein
MLTWVLLIAQHNKVATGQSHAPVMRPLIVSVSTLLQRRIVGARPVQTTPPMMNRIERTTRLEASLAEMRNHPRKHYV